MRKASLAVLLGLALLLPVQGKPKPAPKKEPPVVRLVLPFGAVLGKTTRVTIRGQHLDKATSVRFHDPKIVVKIIRKGKASLPNRVTAQQVGDTEIVADIRLPAGLAGHAISFTVVSPDGVSKPYDLLLDRPGAILKEHEPNDSFARAEALPVPAIVEGKISHPQDVDVYRLEGKAGQRLLLEVWAARHGSPLDSLLMLYDAAGHEIASNDDSGASRDSRLQVTLSRTGAYYAVVMDANDHGSPLHVYRLSVKMLK
jgi:hypothetical protein